jgi:hypothetical protein
MFHILSLRTVLSVHPQQVSTLSTTFENLVDDPRLEASPVQASVDRRTRSFMRGVLPVL